MNRIFAFSVFFLAASVAQADMVFERRDLKDGACCAKGLASGAYYLQMEVAEMHVSLRHAGKVVAFDRAGPWLEGDGRQTVVKECGPVEVKDGDICHFLFNV